MRKEWTKETCYEAAKKCKTKSDFKNQFKAAYKLSLKNDWLKDYYWVNYSHLKEGDFLQFFIKIFNISKYFYFIRRRTMHNSFAI